MNFAGLIFLIVSWGIIIVLNIYCLWKVFTVKKL
jgi:hypothetical protein